MESQREKRRNKLAEELKTASNASSHPDLMETCKWKNQEEEDGIDSHYSTECGTFQWFEGGGIAENHYVFCPYCGRVIVGGA